jgi:hypothetical protein
MGAISNAVARLPGAVTGRCRRVGGRTKENGGWKRRNVYRGTLDAETYGDVYAQTHAESRTATQRTIGRIERSLSEFLIVLAFGTTPQRRTGEIHAAHLQRYHQVHSWAGAPTLQAGGAGRNALPTAPSPGAADLAIELRERRSTSSARPGSISFCGSALPDLGTCHFRHARGGASSKLLRSCS